MNNNDKKSEDKKVEKKPKPNRFMWEIKDLKFEEPKNAKPKP
jgi:hypothetical protein